MSQLSFPTPKVCTCLHPFTDFKENDWYKKYGENSHQPNDFRFVGNSERVYISGERREVTGGRHPGYLMKSS